MSLTAGSPSSAIAPPPLEGQDKHSFQSELRKREAEFQHLQQQNFDLGLKIHHLERKLVDQVEPRRESAEPEPDDFYNFGDDDEENDVPKKTDAHFHDDNPVVQALRRELSTVRADNERLVDKNHQLTDALDDLREKNVADAEESETRRNALHKEMQTLANQVEDMQSENFRCGIEVAQMKDSVQAARAQVDKMRAEAERVGQSEMAAHARSEGLRMQFDVTVKAMEEERAAKESATRKMAEKSLQVASLQKELERAREFAEEARAQNEEAALALQRMQKEIVEMRDERDAAKDRLEKEREKGKMWTDTEKQLRDGDLLLSGDGNALEQLVKVLQDQTKAYDKVSEYEPRWREKMLNDMNECLRALYRSQREVEAKRQHFVDTFCATSSAVSNGSKPPASTPAPVS